MELLTRTQIEGFLSEQSVWEIADNNLVTEIILPDFGQAISFVVGVAMKAEAANHHPDVDIRWNRVKLALSTHSAGGITQADLDLATQISQLCT